MAIYPPGQKFRYHRLLSRRGRKRSVVAILSLTAMVDMFTVLVIFLLQNYNVTGEIIFIPKEVILPTAEKTKELAPALSVTVSNQFVFVDKEPIVPIEYVRNQKAWLIDSVKKALEKQMEMVRLKEEQKLHAKLQKVVGVEKSFPHIPKWKKATVQADRMIEFLTIKKVLYTITEAGIQEINFAVTKETR